MVFKVLNLFFKIIKRKKAVKDVNRICIFKHCCIGDVLMTTPLLEELNIHFPAATIDYVVGSWSKSVLENNQNINKIYEEEKTSIDDLKKNKYDLVIILDIGFRSVWKALKVKGRLLAGIDYNNRGFFLDYKVVRTINDGKHERDIYLGVLESMGFITKTKEMKMYLSDEELEWGEDWIKNHNIEDKEIIAVFAGGGSNPGTIMTLKRWNKYDKLITSMIHKNVVVILLGGDTDVEVNQEIISKIDQKKLNNVIDLAGKITLRQTAVIIKYSKLLVTNDSGPLHIAASVSTPTVSIWGPTDPKRLKPYGEKHIAIVSEECDCRPCYRHIIGDFNYDCQNTKCMTTIEVDRVEEVIYSLGR